MKYKNDTLEISKIQPMREFLASQGKERNYTSIVFYVVLADGSSWVLKLPDSTSDFYNYTYIIGEIAAYKISESFYLNLVPETKMVRYEGNICSLQKFIGDTVNLSAEEYKKCLSSHSQDIVKLKLFWFITGQWDTGRENVLLHNQKLYAIDNANIANITRISSYGNPYFVQGFHTSHSDTGSIENPIEITGTANQILVALAEVFNKELPEFYNKILSKSENNSVQSFCYFIEKGKIFINRKFDNNDADYPEYFIEQNIPINIINSWKSIINSRFFEEVIKDFMGNTDTEILQSLNLTAEELNTKFQQHFGEVQDGIKHRFNVVLKYFETHYTDHLPLVGENYESLSAEC